MLCGAKILAVDVIAGSYGASFEVAVIV